MYVFLFLVLLVWMMVQSSRLSKLESLVKKGQSTPVVPVPTPPASQTVPQTNVPTSGAMPGVPIPSVAATALPVAAKPASKVSDEEASGRILGRIGIGAVVVGMAFFLKYAFDNNWVGPSGRVVIGLLIGIFVMFLGQTLRKKYLNYSDLLVGGGMAILYLSIYSAYGFYHLIDPMVAFMGMIVVTVIGVLMSVLNATQTLSVIALIGGFLTPFMIGTGTLGPWIVFTYITILNAGILGILFNKKWTNLIIIGLIGTWLYFGAWLVSDYKEDLLAPTLLFMLIQFLIFNSSAVFRLMIEKVKATEIDFIVIAATAVSFSVVAYNLLTPKYQDLSAAIAVLLALFYGTMALIVFRENPSDRSINIFLPGLSVAFLTAAVAIEFSGPWVAAWWLVEALVLYIIASTSSSRGYQIMGLLVYILGLFDILKYLTDYVRPSNYQVFFNGPFVMLIMAVIVAYLIAFIYRKYGSVSTEIQARGIVAFVIMANVITLYALTTQVVAYYDLQAATVPNVENLSNTTVSILWALYAALLTAIGFAKRYAVVRRMGLILFILTAFKVVVNVWSMGEIYKIISFITFGIIALVASFVYVRYKDRLKNIV